MERMLTFLLNATVSVEQGSCSMYDTKKWSEASNGVFCGNKGKNAASFMDCQGPDL